MRKKLYLLGLFLALTICSPLYAQKWIEASDLNLIGKPFAETPNAYHRVDSSLYVTDGAIISRQLRCPSGMAVLFRTDSKKISVRTIWGYVYNGVTTMPVAFRGYDLYIKDKNGKWTYAASGANKKYQKGEADEFVLISNMDGSIHECMMYLPMYSEIRSLEIGVDKNSRIEPMESPFRHKIAVYGSSYTQGVGTSRSGMTWPMQFERLTGYEIVSLATSGKCMMQGFMVRILSDVQADAFIFDTFSNPDESLIRSRFIPFVDSLITAHPGVPLIFQQTIYRNSRNFNTASSRKEELKMAAARQMYDSIKGKPQYKDVYFIYPDVQAKDEYTVDGTHPDDYGYTLWTKSIEKDVVKILKKYNIK